MVKESLALLIETHLLSLGESLVKDQESALGGEDKETEIAAGRPVGKTPARALGNGKEVFSGLNVRLSKSPELVVEILSPDDRWSDVMEKLEEYFEIGVQAVWVADPRACSVYVYRSLTDVQRFAAEDELPGGDVLPGFSVPVKELFATE